MKGIRKQQVTVRFNERTRMLLSELSRLTGTSVSAIVRHLVTVGLDKLMDKEGNWSIRGNGTDSSEREGDAGTFD